MIRLGGERDHPVVSSNYGSDSFNSCAHPFVDCFIEGVRIRALLDTGSMKSFLNNHVHNVIDFNDLVIDKSGTHKCVSITGDNLNILGRINAKVNFIHRKHSYQGEFLVSTNIPYDCVLGWDFIINNKLSLELQDGGDYVLCGRHRTTHVRNNREEITSMRAGIIQARTKPDSDRMLCQSTYSSCAGVILTDSVVIPPRSEMILEGKVDRRISSKMGMIYI